MKLKLQCLLLLILFAGCEDFLEIEAPAKELSPELVFAEDATATGAVLGLYFYLWDVGYQVAYRTGLSADDLRYAATDPSRQQYFDNELSPSNSINVEVWNTFFTVINHANAILEGLQTSTELSPDVAKQLEGETRFIRAFTYFHLVNFYGEVPLVLTSDYRVTSVAPRTSTEEIYQTIIEDLTKAKEMLSPLYIAAQRVRANKSAAAALLARTFIFTNNWSAAEIEASEVIKETDAYELNTDLTKVGTANNKEAVLQFYPMNPGINTMEGFFFNPLFGSFTLSGTFLSPGLIASFETGDKRLSGWVGTASDGSQYANKYKVVTGQQLVEYPTVLRLSEQYLIRSEARARLGKLAEGIDDLNIVRARAGLPNLVGLDEPALSIAIEQERRIEFFAEGGHRWFDLKRWDRASTVLAPIKGGTWSASDVLYPIPERELLTNPNMTQNTGY